MKALKRELWAEINLKHFVHNLSLIKQNLHPHTKLMLILKADAYGHGALKLAKVALEHNINYFGVATLEEALELRKFYKQARIFILGYIPSAYALEAMKHNIEFCIYDTKLAKDLALLAQNHNTKALVHIKLDTGMNRLGYKYNAKNLKQIKELFKLKYLQIQGIFTHFASADDDLSYFLKQYKLFQSFIKALPQRKNILYHCANSAAIFNDKQVHMDMVRAGIIAYGLKPSAKMNLTNFKAVMSFKAKIVHIKEINEGESVSYARTFTATKKMKIATLAVGYADGYMRLLSNKAQVLIKGKRARLIGNICMDYCMLDVSDFDDIKIGDTALLFGYDEEGNELSLDELAQHIGTINYELACAISKRVPRIYKN